MDITKHSPFCLELLNEIHANRAVRHLTGGKAFSTKELVEICILAGDKPTWDREAQPKLIATELAIMAKRDPFVEVEGE